MHFFLPNRRKKYARLFLLARCRGPIHTIKYNIFFWPLFFGLFLRCIKRKRINICLGRFFVDFLLTLRQWGWSGTDGEILLHENANLRMKK